jgi:hypothetical protein
MFVAYQIVILFETFIVRKLGKMNKNFGHFILADLLN